MSSSFPDQPISSSSARMPIALAPVVTVVSIFQELVGAVEIVLPAHFCKTKYRTTIPMIMTRIFGEILLLGKCRITQPVLPDK